MRILGVRGVLCDDSCCYFCLHQHFTMMIFNNLDDLGLSQVLCIVKLKGHIDFLEALGCLNLQCKGSQTDKNEKEGVPRRNTHDVTLGWEIECFMNFKIIMSLLYRNIIVFFSCVNIMNLVYILIENWVNLSFESIILITCECMLPPASYNPAPMSVFDSSYKRLIWR